VEHHHESGENRYYGEINMIGVRMPRYISLAACSFECDYRHCHRRRPTPPSPSQPSLPILSISTMKSLGFGTSQDCIASLTLHPTNHPPNQPITHPTNQPTKHPNHRPGALYFHRGRIISRTLPDRLVLPDTLET
jgi:hypothetical protein